MVFHSDFQFPPLPTLVVWVFTFLTLLFLALRHSPFRAPFSISSSTLTICHLAPFPLLQPRWPPTALLRSAPAKPLPKGSLPALPVTVIFAFFNSHLLNTPFQHNLHKSTPPTQDPLFTACLFISSVELHTT